VPFWDIEASVKEVTRAGTELGLTGITMCSEPHAGDLPDLLDDHWNPLWEVCSELELPINFHVGASQFGMEAFFKSVWPSHDKIRAHIVGAVNIELHNSRIMANLLASDLLDRYPRPSGCRSRAALAGSPMSSSACSTSSPSRRPTTSTST